MYEHKCHKCGATVMRKRKSVKNPRCESCAQVYNKERNRMYRLKRKQRQGTRRHRLRVWFKNMRTRAMKRGTFPIYDGVRWQDYLDCGARNVKDEQYHRKIIRLYG